MIGLAPQTSEVFERITCLECIKSFVLVGGTALSLQLNKRQSEDLDFMCWKKSAKDKPEVPISSIKREIEAAADVESMEIGGFNFVSFVVEGVKLSFYAAPRNDLGKTRRSCNFILSTMLRLTTSRSTSSRNYWKQKVDSHPVFVVIKAVLLPRISGKAISSNSRANHQFLTYSD